jgi:hypothetical protein
MTNKMELYLVFINKIGESWEGKTVYEFIFSHTTEDIDGDDWDEYPASGLPSPPNEGFVKAVGRLESELKLDVIQDSDTFAVWDAVDGIVALGWENINDYDEYPDRRLSFAFGEGVKDVEDKLYEKDLILEYKLKNNEQVEE